MQVFGEPKVFDVVAPLENNGKLFATVNVGVHTSLLRAVYEPLLRKAFWLMGFALIVALLAAFLLSNLALRPLAEISRQLDRLTAAGGAPAQGEPAKEKPRRSRTWRRSSPPRSRRSASACATWKRSTPRCARTSTRFWATCRTAFCCSPRTGARCWSPRRRGGSRIERDSILGCHAREIFDRSTVLGRTLREAIEAGVNMVKEEIRTENGRRIQASVDFIYDDETQPRAGRAGHAARSGIGGGDRVGAGAFAAHGGHRPADLGRGPRGEESHQRHRGASGAAEGEAGRGATAARHPAARHLEVIDAEIRRLDRVVQTLVDFSRPVELQSARAGSSPGHRRRAGFGRR